MPDPERIAQAVDVVSSDGTVRKQSTHRYWDCDINRETGVVRIHSEGHSLVLSNDDADRLLNDLRRLLALPPGTLRGTEIH